jgi:DNA-3-methyladenine glycosylase I
MEVMQCGMSWDLMLKKREILKQCFANLDYNMVALYNDTDIIRIMNTEGMIHSLYKIKAIINNAQCYIQVIKEFGSFSRYIWGVTENKVIRYSSNSHKTQSSLSKKLSSDMHKRGFKVLGPVTLYSHLQACGIINSHEECCWKYIDILKKNHIELIDE